MGTHSEVIGTSLADVVWRRKKKYDFLRQAIAGTVAISADMPPVIVFDPGTTARNVLLPADAVSAGLSFMIVNLGTATGVLTLQTSGGAGLTPAATVPVGRMGIVFNDGVSGWKAVVSA